MRRCRIVVEIDHPHAASFSCALTTPAYLADAARFLDHIARFRVAGNKIHEFLPLGVRPYGVGLSHKLRRLDDG